MSVDPNLLSRAGDRCELCGLTQSLRAHDVSSSTARESAIVICSACAAQLSGRAALDPNHWRCLESAIWSEVPAVQAASFRLLERLRAESWAEDLLAQAYLADDVLAWAREGGREETASDDERVVVKDSNGAALVDGDSVTLIKDLDVKGGGFTAKRGTLVKGIRLTDDPRHVEGRIQGSVIVLRTEFLKKA
jgi:protein PhnA